ncbi:MAG: 16S rRNA (cytidine(1402)-2'-O)-methyltransferase [Myxococcaceae bacterium]
MPGTLFLVATPIGNLGDLTARAGETLARADFIICEDTRHTGHLLASLGLKKPTVSLPAFAEKARAERILERLVAGQDAALVTDAGTPAVSDPGEYLVAEALAAGLRVVPIPGPSAVLAALSASGLPTGRFHFLGFLPRQGPERSAMLDEVAGLRASLVIYESPRRLAETLRELAGALGDRRGVVARELTKVHEEFVRGPLTELADKYAAEPPRGEVVLVVEGRTGVERWAEAEMRAALTAGLSRGERLKTLSAELARASGWPSTEVYRLANAVKRSQ